MGESGGMSRRTFLAATASAAALLAAEGCSSSSTSKSSPTTRPAAPGTSGPGATTAPETTTPPVVVRRPGERPDATRPEGTDLLPPIEHIVIVMQENHSYDSYLGMLRRGDGFTLDSSGRPTHTNRDSHGRVMRSFHMSTTCQADSLSQNWNSMHTQWDNGRMDGFVRSPSGPAAMGYWDSSDLPFYYSLASTFPLCDRWFASCFGQTFPNRRFLLCGSALGTIRTGLDLNVPTPRFGTIFDALSRNNISWRDYATTLASVLLFPPVFDAHRANIGHIDEFFRDAAAGHLPSVSFVESNDSTQTEENPQDVSLGEGFTAKVVNAVMQSPTWPKTVLLFCYDEHGGYYDHVAPPTAIAPDDIAPRLKADDAPGDYTRYGFRVPAVVVSPYARPDYVSHVVRDHTAILSFIEHKWNLPALSRRDGASDHLLDTLDLTGPGAFLHAPKLAAPHNATGAPICKVGDPGPIPVPA